jgi:hypothetical protein
VRPDEVSLEAALEICAEHGLKLRAKSKAWRVWVLAELKRLGVVRQALRACGLGPSKLYREMERWPALQTAVDMALGRIDWDEAVWQQTVDEARQRDQL